MARSQVIGIDGSRLTLGERTGTETYSFQLLKAIAENHPASPIRVYLNSAETPLFVPSQFDYVHMAWPRLWTHARLSWEMIRRPPGVLFVPSHVIPAWHPHSVVTIHDLGYIHEPDAHPAKQRQMLEWTTRWSYRAASKIIAISRSTKKDLIDHYQVPESKIQVIHHGISPTFARATSAEVADLKNALNLPDHYVLFVGTIQPRKNIARIAAAMVQLEAAGLPHKLVITGKTGWLAGEVERELASTGRPDLILRIGYVADGDLPALYSGADVFCFPSLYEGFGLPVLEAMACETPVVTSNRSSLPEISGDAALLVDPTSVDEISASLIRVLTDQDERARLTAAGLKRSRNFTWSRTANETLELLESVRDLPE